MSAADGGWDWGIHVEMSLHCAANFWRGPEVEALTFGAAGDDGVRAWVVECAVRGCWVFGRECWEFSWELLSMLDAECC